MPSPIEIYLSSSESEEDKALCEKLLTAFGALEEHGKIVLRHSKAELGKEQASELHDYLERARIILLLVSSDFFGDGPWRDEMRRALERREKGEAIVIPVILRSCDWEPEPYAKLPSLPEGKAIASWDKLDEAIDAVVKGVRAQIPELAGRRPTPLPPSTGKRIAMAAGLGLTLVTVVMALWFREDLKNALWPPKPGTETLAAIAKLDDVPDAREEGLSDVKTKDVLSDVAPDVPEDVTPDVKEDVKPDVRIQSTPTGTSPPPDPCAGVASRARQALNSAGIPPIGGQVSLGIKITNGSVTSASCMGSDAHCAKISSTLRGMSFSQGTTCDQSFSWRH